MTTQSRSDELQGVLGSMSQAEAQQLLDETQQSLQKLQSNLYHVRQKSGYGPRNFTGCLIELTDLHAVWITQFGTKRTWRDAIESIHPVTNVHWTLDFLMERNRNAH